MIQCRSKTTQLVDESTSSKAKHPRQDYKDWVGRMVDKIVKDFDRRRRLARASRDSQQLEQARLLTGNKPKGKQ